MVLDLRFARGGNKNLARPLIHGLLARPHLNRRGSLFTLVARETFSAGMMVALLLEEHSNTLFLGEPTGASPNFASETRGISLPNSGLIASVAEWYWVNSVPWDTRTSLEPDLAAPLTLEDYRTGRDPALELILGNGTDFVAVAGEVLPQRRRDLNRVKLAYAAMMADLRAGEPLTELELRDIARALVGSADYRMGIDLLSAWVRLFPTSLEARLTRADAFVQSGDTARARTDLRQTLLMAPENERAAAMLRELGGG